MCLSIRSSVFLLLILSVCADVGGLSSLHHGRPILDAHNCYPYGDQWRDRLDRALSTGFPVAIEQDLTWRAGRILISHKAQTEGTEPTLREHFFERVRPIVEKALSENNREAWPLIVLHFDFKSEEPDLLAAVNVLLTDYHAWITSAVKTSDPAKLSPLDVKPLLVLTEESDAQEQAFFLRPEVGSSLRIFGSAHTTLPAGSSPEERNRLLAAAPPERLLTAPPTNYRRWWNNSWLAVEEGGPTKAGEWTAGDERRLRALVDHAHGMGYWIRFYNLDGFTPSQNRGWDQTYNFGSRQAVLPRWKAAISAGVDLIATDQYEDLGAILRH